MDKHVDPQPESLQQFIHRRLLEQVMCAENATAASQDELESSEKLHTSRIRVAVATHTGSFISAPIYQQALRNLAIDLFDGHLQSMQGMVMFADKRDLDALKEAQQDCADFSELITFLYKLGLPQESNRE